MFIGSRAQFGSKPRSANQTTGPMLSGYPTTAHDHHDGRPERHAGFLAVGGHVSWNPNRSLPTRARQSTGRNTDQRRFEPTGERYLRPVAEVCKRPEPPTEF